MPTSYQEIQVQRRLEKATVPYQMCGDSRFILPEVPLTMKSILFPSLICVLLFTSCQRRHHNDVQPVNALLGDRSYTALTGLAPTAATPEDLRIRAHLAYAEAVLRSRPSGHLPPRLRTARAHTLGLLRTYWQAGVFPRNYDHPEGRKPCFIDRDGRICAVGYLVEQTVGRSVAEHINLAHQYDAILAMNDAVVDGWIARSGLTKEEAAIIQPTYSPTYNAEPIPRGYAIGTALLGGSNVALGAVNAVQLQSRPGNRAAAFAGLLTGTGQIVLGIAKYPEDEAGGFWGGVVPSQNALRAVSMVNIGVGTATVMLSAWNLVTPLSRDGRTSVRAVSFQTPDGQAGAGLSVCRKF